MLKVKKVIKRKNSKLERELNIMRKLKKFLWVKSWNTLEIVNRNPIADTQVKVWNSKPEYLDTCGDLNTKQTNDCKYHNHTIGKIHCFNLPFDISHRYWMSETVPTEP